MKQHRQFAAFLLRAIVLGLALAFVVGQLAPTVVDRLRQRYAAEAGATASTAAEPRTSYASAVERAGPTVVSIYADKLITERPLRLVPNPTLQRFSGISVGPPRTRLERALGSGVMVTGDGYVLTNHHVIAGADEIRTVLWDGRVTDARIIGSDPETDLAVLKIEGSELPAMRLDPDIPMRVGDVVLAIGNPFGLSQTVTQGIVSGLGRNRLNLNAYEDFIQTDAAINQGNSGGALVNAEGQLLGINTFVLGRLNGAEGIGFAIPVATAQSVLAQIVEHGVVIRGWLGAEYGDAPVMPGTLPADTPRGVALSAVYSGGPAHAAGLRPGDVLLEFNEVELGDEALLREMEAAAQPGSEVVLAGLRAGVPFTAVITLAQRPQPRSQQLQR